MLSGSLIVFRQLLVLLLPTVGDGVWLWLLSGRPAPMRRQAWLWLGLAGLAAHTLLLQSLVYLGMPLRHTTWPALLIALAGLVVGVRAWRCQQLPVTRAARSDAVLYAGILAVGFFGQAVGLFALGPDRFYGNGHYDQANYVVTADFLANEPFDTKVADLGYRPWMFRVMDTKEQRITECVLLGAVAVASGTDSQEAYGTVSIFLVALAGLATAAWLRANGLPRWTAACAGLAAVLSPAVTSIHLDGFFSQSASLFVYPALAGMLDPGGKLRRETKITAALLLAYLIGTYTDVGIFSVTLVGGLVLVSAQKWRMKLTDLGLIFGGALLFNPGYLVRLGALLLYQLNKARNPASMVALFPEGGTWLGWGRLFVDVPHPAMVITAGVLVAALGIWGGVARPTRRWPIAIVLGVAVIPLLLLRASPGFSIYAFAKLTVQFVPVWVGAAMIGVVALRRPVLRPSPAAPIIATAFAAAMFLTALPQHWRVMHPAGQLAQLSSAEMLRLRRAAESNPERTYLVDTDDPLIAQWLCYFGRRSQVVVGQRNLGDQIVPTESFAFRRWSGPSEKLWWLDLERTGPVTGYEPPPLVSVRGALESGTTGLGAYYVAGDSLQIALTRPSGRSDIRPAWLDFVVVPLEPCTVEMTDSAGRRQQTEVPTPGWRRWTLAVPSGETVYQLRFRPASGAGPKTGIALLKSLSVEVAPGIPGLDPVPVAVTMGK